MNPAKEFLLTAFERYLEQNPNQVKQQAMDMCAKYLEEQKQSTQLKERFGLLEEHAKVLESRIDEMLVDYQILRMELEIEQQKNLSTKKPGLGHSSIQLPDFLSFSPRKYRNS